MIYSYRAPLRLIKAIHRDKTNNIKYSRNSYSSNTSIVAQKKKNQKKKASRKRAFDRRHSEGSESEKHDDFDEKVSVGVQINVYSLIWHQLCLHSSLCCRFSHSLSSLRTMWEVSSLSPRKSSLRNVTRASICLRSPTEAPKSRIGNQTSRKWRAELM